MRTAVRRSIAALEMQRARVGYLVQTGVDAADDAKAVLESMEHASRVFGEVWDMRATALDRLKRNWKLENHPTRSTGSPLTAAGSTEHEPTCPPARAVVSSSAAPYDIHAD